MPAEPPEPPVVDCNLPNEPDPPPHPRVSDIVAWTVWAARAYGVIQGERELDRREEACLAELRKKDVIR